MISPIHYSLKPFLFFIFRLNFPDPFQPSAIFSVEIKLGIGIVILESSTLQVDFLFDCLRGPLFRSLIFSPSFEALFSPFHRWQIYVDLFQFVLLFSSPFFLVSWAVLLFELTTQLQFTAKSPFYTYLAHLDCRLRKSKWGEIIVPWAGSWQGIRSTSPRIRAVHIQKVVIALIHLFLSCTLAKARYALLSDTFIAIAFSAG